MKLEHFVVMSAVACLWTGLSFAGHMDKPSGVKIGQRLTLRPFVSFSATYDNNVGSSKGDTEGDVYWTINPALSLEYTGESASLLLDAYYNYRAYCQKHEDISQGNEHSYGENLRFNWGTSKEGEAGWSLILMESFRKSQTGDELGGSAEDNGYCEDRTQVQLGAALQRRFNEKWHADVNGSYYWLDYDNTRGDMDLYGWQRGILGAEAGYAASQWTDFLIAGNYQGYWQDNADDSMRRVGTDISDSSYGWTVQGGFGSYATKRITYRVLAGWSIFEYGDCGESDSGFTYTVSGNWKIGETWNMMLLGSSYYQPSERSYGSSSRVDAFSWGLAKSMIRGKLNANLNITYRHDTNEQKYEGNRGDDFALDEITARLSLNYYLNRYLSIFAAAEYIRCFNDEGDKMYDAYDYDRWRVTIGGRLSY